MKLSTLLSQSFQRHAARTALCYGERTWTYRELEGAIDALSSGLVARGIQAGPKRAETGLSAS
jgi:fatty-acyl-CoA synthase